MTNIVSQNKVIVAENGVIPLPEHIRQLAGLESGDELVVAWVSPNTILIRKVSALTVDDEAFAVAMREFDQALQSAGYATEEDIIRLVREVKAEQITEWTEAS